MLDHREYRKWDGNDLSFWDVDISHNIATSDGLTRDTGRSWSHQIHRLLSCCVSQLWPRIPSWTLCWRKQWWWRQWIHQFVSSSIRLRLYFWRPGHRQEARDTNRCQLLRCGAKWCNVWTFGVGNSGAAGERAEDTNVEYDERFCLYMTSRLGEKLFLWTNHEKGIMVDLICTYASQNKST